MTIPEHIGIILDGNRRWAKARKLPIIAGHRQGAENLKRIALHAFDRGVKFVTVYAFSNENWNRTPKQVHDLMTVFRETLECVERDYEKERVRVRFAGRFERFPDDIRERIPAIEEKTQGGKRGTLLICLGYGGRQEIVDAIKRALCGSLPVPIYESPEALTEEKISAHLYAPDVPDPDLIIRTGGEMRLSGFLTWQSVYSELFFSKTLWPAFSPDELDTILKEFASRKRNFGK